ncbi:MAG: GIY-YIG nuclease family protein [Bacteroidia bacterium]|nr:GIY-YIG nuclease family protein [Bacteroidia bacterium]
MENWKLTWTKLTSLKKDEINKIPDNTQGVYRMSYIADDGKYYVFYVGKAEDLKKRLNEHLNENQNVCIRNYISTKECYFRYAIITKDYVRAAAERQSYKYYQPTCNSNEPEGRDDIQVNLN